MVPTHPQPSAKNNTGEYANFQSALDKILSVSHCEIKTRLRSHHPIGWQWDVIACASDLHVPISFTLQAMFLEIRNDLGDNLSAALNHPNDRSFTFRACATDSPLAFAHVHIARFPADEGL